MKYFQCCCFSAAEMRCVILIKPDKAHELLDWVFLLLRSTLYDFWVIVYMKDYVIDIYLPDFLNNLSWETLLRNYLDSIKFTRAYNLNFFSKYEKLCNFYYNLIIEHIHKFQKKPVSICSHFSFWPLAQDLPFFF